MTKAILRQALAALRTSGTSPHQTDQMLKESAARAALKAAIDAPEPEPEPVAWVGAGVIDALKAGKCVTSTMTKHKAFEDDVQIFTHPPAVREPLHQVLTDPENQPNQYGVEFGMRGSQMTFTIGSQSFTLAYEPDEPGEFEYMRDMLIKAFSIFTPDVKIAVREQLSDEESIK